MIDLLKNLRDYISQWRKKVHKFSKFQQILTGLVFSLVMLGFGGYFIYILRDIKVVRTETENISAAVDGVARITDAEIAEIIKNGAPILGDPDAKITIVEFADFQCPFCRRFFRQILPEIKKRYIETGKARLVYVNFPLLGTESYFSAQAARCAQDQKKFWEYHDNLYGSLEAEAKNTLSVDHLKKFATYIGLETSQFNQCLDGNKYGQRVKDELALGRSLGINGTPSIFVGGTLIEGVRDLEYFTGVIDMALIGR